MVLFAEIVGVLFLIYLLLMLMYKEWFVRLKPFEPLLNYSPKTSFSILVPARNEAENIGTLLQSIYQQHYPKELWEVIVIDDFSTDSTPKIVLEFNKVCPNIKLIKLSDVLNGERINSYKKKAIETGIAQAENDWIVTTDADCLAGKEWLTTFNAYIQEKDPVFVGGPVSFLNDGSGLQTFQCIDFLALQGITAAAVSAGFHAMCNGANLAYKKEVFYAVNGFKGIDKIASGDDMLLMNKIKKRYPQKIGYVFSPKAIIKTLPMDTLKSFINQRIRWASKGNKYKDVGVKAVLWVVLLVNIGLLIMPFMAFYYAGLIWYWLLMIVLKTLIEASFAVRIAAFFPIKLNWKDALLQFPHIIYTSLAGCLGMFGKYQWKDRRVR